MDELKGSDEYGFYKAFTQSPHRKVSARRKGFNFMATNRSVDSRFWSDGWVRKLNALDRYAFLYFLTNEHSEWCGVYELPLDTMAFESGIKEDDLLNAILPRLEPKILYIDGWVFVPNWLKYHASASGNFSPQQLKGVETSLEAVPSRIIEKIKERLDTLCIPYPYPIGGVLASTSTSTINNTARTKVLAPPSKESAKKTTGTDSVSQSNDVTLEEYLEQFEEIEKYNPAIEDVERAWMFPGVKTPQVIEQMEKRYSTHLRGQTRVSEPSRGQLEASSVWLRWVELCEKELGKKPIADAKSRAIIKFAIDKVGKDEVMEVIEDWFHQGKPDEETIQITRALSGHQLNSFIARK